MLLLDCRTICALNAKYLTLEDSKSAEIIWKRMVILRKKILCVENVQTKCSILEEKLSVQNTVKTTLSSNASSAAMLQSGFVGEQPISVNLAIEWPETTRQKNVQEKLINALPKLTTLPIHQNTPLDVDYVDTLKKSNSS